MARPIPGKQYTIIDEDSLSVVARRAYGNSNHWPRIWRANQSNLKSGDPDLIYPGEVIFIPELAELLPDEPSISNREPDELSIVIDGLEIRHMAARVIRTIDTASDGWTATINWLPGDNPELDRRLRPYSYPPVKVYIGGKLFISGRLYVVTPNITTDQITVDLVGFSKTADLIDSNLRPPYEENGVTLKQRVQKLVQPFGIKAVFEADTGGVFDRITANETETVFAHLNKLAKERGVLISSTPNGDLLLTEADTRSKPVATLEQGVFPVLDFGAAFDGRRRFNTYRAINVTPFGSNEGIVKDKNVPRSRMKTFSVQESTRGEIYTAARWERNKSIVDALTIAIPVVGWLNERTGEPWQENQKVTVISPAIFVPNGFDFLIRSVEFEERESEKKSILNIIPPQVYTKEAIVEPWK